MFEGKVFYAPGQTHVRILKAVTPSQSRRKRFCHPHTPPRPDALPSSLWEVLSRAPSVTSPQHLAKATRTSAERRLQAPWIFCTVCMARPARRWSGFCGTCRTQRHLPGADACPRARSQAPL
eukprot:scaffold7095_cov260-Pinguiococcus_pyrenoidosus.AAC.18